MLRSLPLAPFDQFCQAEHTNLVNFGTARLDLVWATGLRDESEGFSSGLKDLAGRIFFRISSFINQVRAQDLHSYKGL